VKRGLGLIALACFAVAPAQAAIDAEHEVTPAVTKIVDFAKPTGMKMLVYFELDDARPDGQAIITMTILAQPPGSTTLVSLDQTKVTEFIQGIASEASASGIGGWRRIVIVIENGEVTVDRDPRLGPIEGMSARLRAETDRVFPGHTSPSRAAH
jgi:hypothetical protein